MSLNLPQLQAATKVIHDAERILIIPHANVDADGLSSTLALYSVLSANGKSCTAICPDILPDSLSFLPQFDRLKTSIPLSQQFVITLDMAGGIELDTLKYTVEDEKVNIIVTPKKGYLSPQCVHSFDAGSSYDLIIVVDTAELSLLGSFYTDHIEFFSNTPILNIDHHVSNSRFGQSQLIDPTCASATEVLYTLFQSYAPWKEAMNADIATLLLTGLITDTRSFQNPNTTPKSLEVAANLLDLGARQQEIIRCVYKTKPLSTLKIWGRALNSIQVDADARIVWSAVSREDLEELGATSKETHGLLDELISTIPDADIHVLFTEMEEGGLKASMRSSLAVDVNQLSGKLFGGGGHARASGFRIKQYPNFQLQVLECIQKMKDALKAQSQETVPQVSAPQKSVVPERQVPVSTQEQKPIASLSQSTDVLQTLSNQTSSVSA